MRLYVGNLSYDTSENSLEEAFSAFGPVDEVAVMTDRDTGRSRGFGFVTMSSDEDGRKAMEELNGADLDGRSIVVNEARPRTENRGGGGGGGGRGGGGGQRRERRW